MQILFVPGFHGKVFDAASEIGTMKAYLGEKGFKVDVVDYSKGMPTDQSLEVYAKVVAEDIETTKPFAIIAHSMGGLITRLALQMTSTTVKKVIFLESPNGGITLQLTPAARMVGILLKPSLSSVRCMMRGSDFLQKLEGPNKEISYSQIGGFYSLVLPKVFVSPDLPMQIFPVTHEGLKKNTRVLAAIVRILKN